MFELTGIMMNLVNAGLASEGMYEFVLSNNCEDRSVYVLLGSYPILITNALNGYDLKVIENDVKSSFRGMEDMIEYVKDYADIYI